MKAAEFAIYTEADAALVSTNSICQGRSVPILWPRIFETGSTIHFAHTSFKWANLASHNAGVTVVIVGLSRRATAKRAIYHSEDGETLSREVRNISPYLINGENTIVDSRRRPLSKLPEMSFGNMPVDGGNLLLTQDEVAALKLSEFEQDALVRRVYGSAEFIRGTIRNCIWIENDNLDLAMSVSSVRQRIEAVEKFRLDSKDKGTNEMASRAYQFREMNIGIRHTIILPGVSSEGREYLQPGLLDNRSVVTNLAFALYDAPLWCFSLLASKLHFTWTKAICGQLETRIRYSNTLGWNTFPMPSLTEKNKSDLTRCAEEILMAREVHFPATIADLYDPDKMPDDLRRAHERNDEVLERIYIGRRFKNDTERLEKLFELYTKMTSKVPAEVNA